jgi:hypothetical protein
MMNSVNIKTEISVRNGLEFILQHISVPEFPRNIMTQRLGKQVLVINKKEAIKHFKESNFLDCRLSAYPPITRFENNMIAPSLIFIDLDRSRFSSERVFKLALSKTLTNIETNLRSIPTVLWSGNGNHIIQPISALVLDGLDLFSSFDKPSVNFLRWSEQFLSNGKSDVAHTKTLSFGNCMLRIPGSHNSKCVAANGGIADKKSEVSIIQKWNGHSPHIRSLLGSYHAYLVDQKQKNDRFKSSEQHWFTTNNQAISWIEKLLITPLPDYRKMMIWLVLSRYLINVRGMTYKDAFSLIKKWVIRCNEENPLCPGHFDSIIRDRLKQATRDKRYPIGLSRIKSENIELYNLLLELNVIQ